MCTSLNLNAPCRSLIPQCSNFVEHLQFLKASLYLVLNLPEEGGEPIFLPCVGTYDEELLECVVVLGCRNRPEAVIEEIVLNLIPSPSA
jgi:hypothetical protein